MAALGRIGARVDPSIRWVQERGREVTGWIERASRCGARGVVRQRGGPQTTTGLTEGRSSGQGRASAEGGGVAAAAAG